MIVTFCGHSNVADVANVKVWLYEVVESKIQQGFSTFYLGGYGSFDHLCAFVVHDLKKKYPHIESILILPYLDKTVDMTNYDDTIYPPLENTPKRYCIVKRNKWMVENSDCVISYVTHSFGGAAQTYEHAIKKGKEVINYGISNH